MSSFHANGGGPQGGKPGHHSNMHGNHPNAQQAAEMAKRTRTELLKGPVVAPTILKSRELRPTTILDSDTRIPAAWIRSKREGYNKDSVKRKVGLRERELPEGQHENLINGVWHCSNCGCPEDIAIGRRQGPLGPKTMCGQCGKWWHRHRKPLEVVWRTDKEFHLEKRKKDEEARKAKKRGGQKGGFASAHLQVPGTPGSSSRPANGAKITPRRSPHSAVLQSPESSLSPPAMSPPVRIKRLPQRDSAAPPESSNSNSEPPNSSSSAPPPPPPSAPASASLPPPPPPTAAVPTTATTTPRLPPPPPPPAPEVIAEILAAPPPSVSRTGYRPIGPLDKPDSQRPSWLGDELVRLRAKYPEDSFDVLQRSRPPAPPPVTADGAPPPPVAPPAIEWRVRCTDCPGKVSSKSQNDGRGADL